MHQNCWDGEGIIYIKRKDCPTAPCAEGDSGWDMRYTKLVLGFIWQKVGQVARPPSRGGQGAGGRMDVIFGGEIEALISKRRKVLLIAQ